MDVHEKAYICRRVRSSDEQLLQEYIAVDERGTGLEVYLKKYAIKDEENDLMRTYLVEDPESNEFVGYFSLKAGFISLKESLFMRTASFSSLPAIELANFGVNKVYKDAHPRLNKIGQLIFVDCVLPTVKAASEIVGVKALYIFALPYESLIENYERYGFKRLAKIQERAIHRRIKPSYDKSCIFMYQII